MKKIVMYLALALFTLPVATMSWAAPVRHEKVVVVQKHHHHVKKHVVKRHHPVVIEKR
ncbi:hypothetical protein [Sodalis sp. dw_96]|uniref:hypothetical protein n=1 Tax=Sodalis sp. dw_96 TaxID=2719794 RepID=UPI001BD31612|nr:hypothetical protein [Sodalis sp. dw_96]